MLSIWPRRSAASRSISTAASWTLALPWAASRGVLDGRDALDVDALEREGSGHLPVDVAVDEQDGDGADDEAQAGGEEAEGAAREGEGRRLRRLARGRHRRAWMAE
jgi:hypothetical protein